MFVTFLVVGELLPLEQNSWGSFTSESYPCFLFSPVSKFAPGLPTAKVGHIDDNDLVCLYVLGSNA